MDPFKDHYIKLHTVDHRMLLQMLEVWGKSSNNGTLPYENSLPRTGCESVKTVEPTKSLL